MVIMMAMIPQSRCIKSKNEYIKYFEHANGMRMKSYTGPFQLGAYKNKLLHSIEKKMRRKRFRAKIMSIEKKCEKTMAQYSVAIRLETYKP